MLIDTTYFENQLKIANINEPDPDNTFREDLSVLIEKCEEYVLSFSMGVDMWLDFKNKYIQDPDNLPQNYKDILYGKTYTVRNNGIEKMMYWKGLINKEKKESLLAYYVYIIYQQQNVYQTTAFGQTKIEGKIGELVSSTPKITRIHNEFINMLYGDINSSYSGITIDGTPYWVIGNGGIDYQGSNRRSGFVSFIQFLLDNKKEYPLLETGYNQGEFGVKNEFGI